MWNVLVWDSSPIVGSLIVEVLDSGTNGLLAEVASLVEEIGSTVA